MQVNLTAGRLEAGQIEASKLICLTATVRQINQADLLDFLQASLLLLPTFQLTLLQKTQLN